MENERSQQNRRGAQRRKSGPGVKVICQKGSMGMGANVALGVLDLSESGLRFIAKEELQKGKDVEINLEGPGARKPLKRIGTVVWSAALDDGTFAVGVKFQKYLNYADLHNFV